MESLQNLCNDSGVKFEFDEAKSQSNKLKHGLDFVEAQAVWNGVRIEIDAKLGDGSQKCYAVLGKSGKSIIPS